MNELLLYRPIFQLYLRQMIQRAITLYHCRSGLWPRLLRNHYTTHIRDRFVIMWAS